MPPPSPAVPLAGRPLGSASFRSLRQLLERLGIERARARPACAAISASLGAAPRPPPPIMLLHHARRCLPIVFIMSAIWRCILRSLLIVLDLGAGAGRDAALALARRASSGCAAPCGVIDEMMARWRLRMLSSRLASSICVLDLADAGQHAEHARHAADASPSASAARPGRRGRRRPSSSSRRSSAPSRRRSSAPPSRPG